jgi:hypothetical protein
MSVTLTPAEDDRNGPFGDQAVGHRSYALSNFLVT